MRNPCPDCGSRTGYREFDSSTYCHKCHKWTSKGVTGLYKKSDQVIASLVIKDKVVYNVDAFSTDALKWLYQYFVFDEMIRKYKIGYIPATHRLYFPLYNEKDHLVYYITRALIPGDKKYICCSGITSPIYTINNFPDDSDIILVEDFISAIRVAQFMNVLFVQGTGITKDVIKHVYKNYNRAYTWFDYDLAGKTAVKDFETKMRKYEEDSLESRLYMQKDPLRLIKIRNVETEKDPKCYTNEEIKEILN